jgi:hypothetical protein
MTKLEELKAAGEAASYAAAAAWVDYSAARDAPYDDAWTAAVDTAWVPYDAACKTSWAAYYAYRAELIKTQKENSND